jgi:hypothetical protein
MIVSASRRSDIPAFHGAWFMEQLRGGRVLLANPFRPGRVRAVSLNRRDVDAFVFWSRDPRPFMTHLPEIDRGGFPYYFMITATGYPNMLEPAAPSAGDVVTIFSVLATAIGRRRVIWRYDPVIFTSQTTFAFHTANFARLTRQLAPYTTRVVVSFFDPYPKVLRRLRRAGIDPQRAEGTPGQQQELLAVFAARAAAAGLELQSCAEAGQAAGVRAGKCIDDELLNELFALNLSYRKDPAQRKLCLCQQSVDIGSYGSCTHGCLYCYARP